MLWLVLYIKMIIMVVKLKLCTRVCACVKRVKQQSKGILRSAFICSEAYLPIVSDLMCSMKTGKCQVRLCLINHPLPSRKNSFSITKFINARSVYEEIITNGDLNFHFYDAMNSNVHWFSV